MGLGVRTESDLALALGLPLGLGLGLWLRALRLGKTWNIGFPQVFSSVRGNPVDLFVYVGNSMLNYHNFFPSSNGSKFERPTDLEWLASEFKRAASEIIKLLPSPKGGHSLSVSLKTKHRLL